MKLALASTIGQTLYVVNPRGAVNRKGKMIAVIELRLDMPDSGKGYETLDNENERLTLNLTAEEVCFMPPAGFTISMKIGTTNTADGECEACVIHKLCPPDDEDESPAAAPRGPKN